MNKNTKNIFNMEMNYSTLQNKIDEILKERGAKSRPLIFSMFYDDDSQFNTEKWMVKAPDFNSLFENGNVKFIDQCYDFESEVIKNPTWGDLIYWANESIIWGMEKENLDGWDHVYLEAAEFKEEINGVKIFEFWFGS